MSSETTYQETFSLESSEKKKFLLICSCLLCNKEMTVQSLSQHVRKHINDEIPKKYCLFCDAPIFTNEKKFCNTSCAAAFNNKNRQHTETTKLKISESLKKFQETIDRTKDQPLKSSIPIYRKPRKKTVKISICAVCNMEFQQNRPHSNAKTCRNKECRSTHLSNRIRQSIFDQGRNPNSNRGRGKRSYLETSFENWLHKNEVLDFETEKHFRRPELTKSYFADFFFPSLNLIIELDGSQHNQTKEYDDERDAYIRQKYNVRIVRITEKEYRSGSRIEEIKNILGILSECSKHKSGSTLPT